ncbi:MAG: ATP-binding protein [Chthoniobacterales bacterium]
MRNKLYFASHPANLWLVRQCVRRFLQNRPFSLREIDLMVLGVDEACTNIIRHAYHLEDDQLISLSFESCQGGAVRFRLRDYGEPLDVDNSQLRPIDHSRPGGLGMHLIRHAFDQIDYHQKRTGTLLVLTKFRGKSAGLVPHLEKKLGARIS